MGLSEEEKSNENVLAVEASCTIITYKLFTWMQKHI